MTKIILFVIFLQVVFGILAKRKARKNAEEAARNPDGGMGEGAVEVDLVGAEPCDALGDVLGQRGERNGAHESRSPSRGGRISG